MNAQVSFRCVFVLGLQVCSFSATVAKYFRLSVRLTVTLGIRLGIGLAIGLGLGIVIGVGLGTRLALGIGITDLNQIADLKLSILAPIQIADLNLTPCL